MRNKVLQISIRCLGCGALRSLNDIEAKRIPPWPAVDWPSGTFTDTGKLTFCFECHRKMADYQVRVPLSWCSFSQVDEALGELSWWTRNHKKMGRKFDGGDLLPHLETPCE